MNLPNKLTVLRVILIPFFLLFVLLFKIPHHMVFALIVFAAASITDWFDGDPLEIYTNPDGEVIFKKYSAINEMSEGAAQAAEVISKLGGAPAVVFDKDHVVAVSGVPKKEYSQRRLSPALEELLENRKTFDYTDTTAEPLRAVEGITTHALTIAPILTNGDITGAVAFMATDDTELCTDKQSMLAKAAAMFLGKQIEE